MPRRLRREDRPRAATEAAVVNPGDGGVVVGELGGDLVGGDGRGFGLLGGGAVGFRFGSSVF